MKFTLVAATLLLVTVSSTIAKDWYETETFYQIYPRSFADSNNDGVGDINGIIARLPYLKDLGITATWLSPIFVSPMKDFGYDIADYYNVDPVFGTMADLETLFAEAAKLNIKIILDFVPNHSSDACEWFQKSILRDPVYDNYYIWNDGIVDNVTGIRRPPNNWNSVFNGHAWTWNSVRQQYFFHQFTDEQPDLNFRNPAVLAELENILLFWLGKGASGFRVDAVNHLFEDALLRDEPIDDPSDDTAYAYTLKIYTKDQKEVYDVVYSWRNLLDNYKTTNGGDTRIMMSEAYTNETNLLAYYGNDTQNGSHMPFNFLLLNLNDTSSAQDFLDAITHWLSVLPAGKVTNWVVGNHDQPRVASRYGRDRIDGMLALVMTLPGIAVTYQGDEIGMTDNRDGITFAETLDPQGILAGPINYKTASRDPERTPFQWDNSNVSAGFNNGSKTWLPVNPNYKWLNLADQKVARHSTYQFYKQLIAIRSDPTFIYGTFEPAVFNGNVLTFVRAYEGKETYLVLINFAEVEQIVNVHDVTTRFSRSPFLKVVTGGADTFYQPGDTVETNSVYLRKHEVIIVKAVPSIWHYWGNYWGRH